MLLLLSRKSSLQFSTFSSRPIYTTMSLLLLLLIYCNTDSLHTIVYVYHPLVLLLLLFFVVKLRLYLFCPIFQLSTITCVQKCCDYMLHAKHCCSLWCCSLLLLLSKTSSTRSQDYCIIEAISCNSENIAIVIVLKLCIWYCSRPTKLQIYVGAARFVPAIAFTFVEADLAVWGCFWVGSRSLQGQLQPRPHWLHMSPLSATV